MVYNIIMNIIPIFLPHGGCKSRCTFCNEYAATGLRKLPKRVDITLTVEKYLSFFKDKRDVELAFYGGSFTGLENFEAYLNIALELFDKKIISGIRFSTSPGQLSEATVASLENYPIRFIELGVQSFDPKVLKACNRDHDIDDIHVAVESLKRHHIPFGLHLMSGLPGDTEEKDLQSALKAVETGAKSVRLHPLVILKGSELSLMYERGEFSPPGLFESIETLWKMHLIITRGGVKVSRVGICLYGNEIESMVAGPYHPALGELVKNRVALEVLLEYAREERIDTCSLDLSHKQEFTGYKRCVLEGARKAGLKVNFKPAGVRLNTMRYSDSIREKLLEVVHV